MADSSLDDFFAKKDKTRRSKNKGKVPIPDQQLPKKFDDGKKPERSLKKDKEKNNPSGNSQSVINAPVREQTQEEWNEVNDEEKDYSSLRLQALTLDKEKEEGQEGNQQGQEDGDEAHSNEGPQGPWKKSHTSASADAESPDGEKDDDEQEEEEPPASTPAEAAPAAAPTKYVPPSRRNQLAGGAPLGGGGGGRRYNKSVPEMTSELHFPSLSSAIDPSVKGARSQMNDKSFQSVKHGSRYKDDMSHSGVHLDLENKYAALRRREN